MPLDLRSLQQRGATITIEVYDMSAGIVYDPTKFSPGFRADYNAQQRKERDEALAIVAEAAEDNTSEKPERTARDLYRANARFLESVVKSWEINGVNGKPLPVKADAILDNLPDSMVQYIAMQIWSDVANVGKPQKPREDTTPSAS